MDAQEAAQPFHWHSGELVDRNILVHRSSLLVLLIVFSAAVLLGVLYLYLRWSCRYRLWASAATLSPEAAAPQPAAGVDMEIIDSLPVRLHKSVHPGDEAQCSICLGGLAEGEKVKVLPSCSHSFHPECVDEWLTAHPTCPLCRALLGGLAPAEGEAVV